MNEDDWQKLQEITSQAAVVGYMCDSKTAACVPCIQIAVETAYRLGMRRGLQDREELVMFLRSELAQAKKGGHP